MTFTSCQFGIFVAVVSGAYYLPTVRTFQVQLLVIALLRLWPARTFAASGGRSYRNLCVFDFGFVESRSMAADRHRLQSRAVGVLQI